MRTASAEAATAAALFRPVRLGPLELANRIAMAPMSRYLCPDGVPHEGVAAYYRRRAENGVGLIITEGTYIGHPSAASYDGVPFFAGEAALDGWASVLRAVHGAGGRIFPQLWHTGSFRQSWMGPVKGVPGFGPSENLNAFTNHPEPTREMSEADITAVVDAYARAAADAQRLGFDGVEIHAAHGYLIDEFFWSAPTGEATATAAAGASAPASPWRSSAKSAVGSDRTSRCRCVSRSGSSRTTR